MGNEVTPPCFVWDQLRIKKKLEYLCETALQWCSQTLMCSPCESPGLQDSRPVSPKGSQPLVFIGRTDAEAEAPILWPPDVKSQLIGKAPVARKD